MRFTLMNDAMQAAMVQFCTEQDFLSEYLPEDEIESLLAFLTEQEAKP